ncbi:MAG: hypothetical protein CL521_05500 [Actinobacteria bacterium]|nr:hypothetical protein [Actinomycetota bacterium]
MIFFKSIYRLLFGLWLYYKVYLKNERSYNVCRSYPVKVGLVTVDDVPFDGVSQRLYVFENVLF